MKLNRIALGSWGLSCVVFLASAGGAAAAETSRGELHAFRHWFPLSEAGVSYRLNSTKERINEYGETVARHDRVRVDFDYGAMANLNHSEALGGALFALGHEDGGSLGLRGRYRRWLSPLKSIDYSLGISLTSWSDFDTPLPFSPLAGVTYSYRDRFLVKGQVEVTRFEHAGNDVAVCGGVSLGSTPGVITTAAMAVAAGIALAVAVSTMQGL